MDAIIGKHTPNLEVSEWIQGEPTNFDQEIGHIVLVAVFQVNCPGCFISGIPEAMYIHSRYYDKGVRVLGIATAFEDFDKNNLENLKLLVEKGELIGEAREALSKSGQLKDGFQLPYKIPFPIGMDLLISVDHKITEQHIMQFINTQIPEFDTLEDNIKEQIIQQVSDHLNAKEFAAQTFEKFALKGTPSTILIDRKGILQDISFGQIGKMEKMIRELL